MGVNIILPNSTKRRGRPRKFDEQQALDAAVEVFWLKGFDGSSLDDLTTAMSINRPSFYSAFGDKKALYLRCLNHYAEGIGSDAMRAFLAEVDIRQAIEKFLEQSLACQTRSEDKAQGCLLANCASTSLETVREAQPILMDVLVASSTILIARFKQEMSDGNLPNTFPAETKASLLLDLVQAQAYRARIGQAHGVLSAAISRKAEMVFSS